MHTTKFFSSSFLWTSRCCEDTFQIHSKEIKVEDPEPAFHEVLACALENGTFPFGSKKLINSSALEDHDEYKICDDGKFHTHYDNNILQSFELGQNGQTIEVNRTWRALPDLSIPIDSDEYCVSYSLQHTV